MEVREAAARALGKIGDPRAVEPLIQALVGKYWSVRMPAAWALDQLGWKPGQDENAAWYWIAKKEWEQCVALGRAAVEPLIKALSATDSYVRREAARVLVTLYHSGRIPPESKQRILEFRSKITAPHHDEFCDPLHQDYGIGVDFPL